MELSENTRRSLFSIARKAYRKNRGRNKPGIELDDYFQGAALAYLERKKTGAPGGVNDIEAYALGAAKCETSRNGWTYCRPNRRENSAVAVHALTDVLAVDYRAAHDDFCEIAADCVDRFARSLDKERAAIWYECIYLARRGVALDAADYNKYRKWRQILGFFVGWVNAHASQYSAPGFALPVATLPRLVRIACIDCNMTAKTRAAIRNAAAAYAAERVAKNCRPDGGAPAVESSTAAARALRDKIRRVKRLAKMETRRKI